MPELAEISHLDTLDHCTYIGTKGDYHYIIHYDFKVRHKYKVKKEDLYLKKTFPLRQDKPYLVGSIK